MFHIYRKDFEDYEYCERQGGRYKPVLVDASTKEEALEIFLSERGWIDEGLFYAVSDEKFKKHKEEENKLKEMGYNSWDEYYEDLYPNRPMEV